MSKPNDRSAETESTGAEGVPVDAPDNTAPAISPSAVSRMHRAEDDDEAQAHSPDFSDERTVADDRVSGQRRRRPTKP